LGCNWKKCAKRKSSSSSSGSWSGDDHDNYSDGSDDNSEDDSGDRNGDGSLEIPWPSEDPSRPFDHLGECGLDCLAIGHKDKKILQECLGNATDVTNLVWVGRGGVGNLTSTNDVSNHEYDAARRTRNGYLTRFPEVVVYAKNKRDVEDAVRCAVYGGWQVSALGGRHTLFGVVDGYVVVETSNITDTPVHDADAETLKFGSGVTHGMVVNALREYAPKNAMLSIGNGGSVGFMGYMIGGGLGYATPAIGLGCDSIVELETVLYNGTVITAHKEGKHADIIWGTCGGGAGLGVITSVTVKYTLAKKYVKNYSFGTVTFKKQNSIEDQAQMISDVLEYFGSIDNNRFGGQVWVGPNFRMNGLFQGSLEQTKTLMNDLSLSKYVDSDGYDLTETDSFPHASAYFVCRWIAGQGDDVINDNWDEIAAEVAPLLGENPEDLDVTQFTDGGYCRNHDFLDALIDLTADRDSIFTWGLYPTLDPKVSNYGDDSNDWSGARPTGGKIRFIPVPSTGVLESILRILDKTGANEELSITRLGSGEVMKKAPTAFAWRHSPLLMRLRLPVLVPILELLQNSYPNQIGGYYGLSDTLFNANWQRTFYGENYREESIIRGFYDPLDTFGKKYTPDQTILKGSATQYGNPDAEM